MARKKNKSRKGQDLTEVAARTPTTKAPSKATWKLMDRGSAIAAGLVAHRASETAWRVVTGRKAPSSGRHPDVDTREAVVWAVVGGAIVELVRVGVRRGAATYWVKSTGQLPPGMKPLSGPGRAKEPAPTEPAPPKATTKVSRRSRGR